MPSLAVPAVIAVTRVPSFIEQSLRLYESYKEDKKRAEEEKRRTLERERAEKEKPIGRAALSPFLKNMGEP